MSLAESKPQVSFPIYFFQLMSKNGPTSLLHLKMARLVNFTCMLTQKNPPKLFFPYIITKSFWITFWSKSILWQLNVFHWALISFLLPLYNTHFQDFLEVHWLRLCTSTAGGTGSIPHAMQHGQDKQTKHKLLPTALRAH